MAGALIAHAAQVASRAMVLAGVAGVAIATGLTLWPEWDRLSPHLGQISPLAILRAVDLPTLYAVMFGLFSVGAAVRVLRGDKLGRSSQPGLKRAQSDNYGHADWLAIKAAQNLFPGPDAAYSGLVVGEAYRVDQDRVAGVAFDPADRRTWGQGGTAPLLIDPCRSGPTHALVVAGSGGFKTTSIGVPTMLTWTGSAVVLVRRARSAPWWGGFGSATSASG